MKEYIEAIEQIEEEPECFKEEVISNDEETIVLVESLLHPLKTYSLRKHFCYHEEGLACETEEIVYR